MKKMDPVVHFEMPAQDLKRMVNFYSAVFGWQNQVNGEDLGDYVITTTSECDEAGWPKERGRINGGFYQQNQKLSVQYPTVVIAVDNIRESITQIEAAGGKVLGEPIEIPNYGLYVSFTDTEDNRVSIIQPSMHMNED